MATTYSPAPDAASIATDLIKKHHTRLADVRIEFVFRDEASKSGGRPVLGKAKKVSGLNAFMARSVTCDLDFDDNDSFFLIELAHDEWLALSAKGRKALVDHHLCQLTVEYDEKKDEWRLGLRSPDVAEFAEVIERHGMWNDDLTKFGEAVKTQLQLFEPDAA